MSDVDEAEPAVSSPSEAVASNQVGSIGGWLILVLLWLLYVPLAELPVLLPLVSRMLPVLFKLPTTLAGLVACQFTLILFLEFIAPVLLLILMLRYRASFPRYYIGWTIASSTYGFLNVGLTFWIVQLASPADAIWHPSSMIRPVLIACIGLGIWVPYMLRSKRVRNTFVK
jgi:hypothetical protein